MARAKATTVQQEREIRRCVSQGITAPKQVHRHLEAEGLLAGEDWVCEKTVARRIREFTPHDESGPWSLANADPDEARIILDVLALALDGRSWPTRAMAQWIAHVKTVAPDIPSYWALSLAQGYHACRDDNYKYIRYLDMVLILRPWASESDLEWFVYIVQCSRQELGPPSVLQWALMDVIDDVSLQKLAMPAERPGRTLRAWE